MTAAKRVIKQLARSLGYDVVRFPHPGSLGAHLLALFDRLRITCVLDVGAHAGGYAAFLREIGYDGRIVSFEPVRESFRRLEERSARDPSWSVHRLALGSVPGAREIDVTHGTTFSSFLPRSAYSAELFGAVSATRARELVEVRRLDDELARHAGEHDRVFLKVDTQGWDLEVVRGAERSLEQVLALQTEVSVKPLYEGAPSYLEAIPYLTSLGYELTGLFAVDRDPDLRLTELDCVMTRVGSSRPTNRRAPS